MLKIPTFILGGLLILTGLIGYLFQAPSKSIKITGQLADDAQLTLSDGTQTHIVKLGYSSDSAGDQAKAIITGFYGDDGHATIASQKNNVIEHNGKGPEGIESFWYASSRGDTLESLVQYNKNLYNEDPDYEKVPVIWDEVDTNSSTIKFVYINSAGNSGPATLQVSNWKNIDIEPTPKNNTLEFGKSKTAFIPSVLGLLLILLVLAAEAKPSARKHIMHLAVLLGLVGFIAVTMQIGSAYSEMSWLRGKPNGIIHASSLKATTMLASAGLLLIFVILCVVSFVTARKEMAAQKKAEAEKKKKVLDKVKTKNEEADDKKSDTGDEDDKKEKPSEDKKKEDEKKSDDDAKDSDSKDSKDKKDSSQDSDKKEEKEKDSEDKDESEDSKKADDNSKSSDAPKPEPETEAAKATEDAPETKKEDEESTVEKKSPEAPKDNSDVEEKKPEEPSKEASSTNDSDSSSDSDSKDQEDSDEEKEATPKPDTEEKKEEDPEPKSDPEKSDKEENKE